jgi:ERCC4-type nuclease
VREDRHREFLIARNPDAESSLPFLLRIPLGEQGIVLKARDTWPRTGKVYCHRSDDGWPLVPDLVEAVRVRSCVRRGAAIDLVLDRSRENRSQFVLTQARGRQVVFWQSARTTRQARPNAALPTARASGLEQLEILVDAHERYPWKFRHQQVVTRKRPLACGDYGVELDGHVVAVVERKSLADLSTSLTTGRLRYALAELAALPRAAVVVEDRYSRVFDLKHVRPSVVADALAECQARFPSVPVIFAETRALAQEWTYRFLAAALSEVAQESGALERVAELQTELQTEPAESAPAADLVVAPVPSVVAFRPSPAEVREWAKAHGYAVGDRGRVSARLWDACRRAGLDQQ